MNEQLVHRIRQCPTLPSLPAIAMQVLDLVQQPDTDINQIARVISKDAALASKILKTVNSSFYARSNAVSTVSHAIVILGLQSVKTLVLGFSLASNLREQGFKHMGYWRRSIYSATAARTIAAKVGVIQQEEAFLAGLLSDVGTLALHQALGEEYDKICSSAATHEALLAAEREHLSMDHAQASGILAEQWKLPPILAVPMAFHHDHAAVADASMRTLAETICVSGRCADVFLDAEPAQAIADVRKLCAELFRMSEAECDAMMNEVGARAKEVAPLFEIPLTSTDGYDQILKRATTALTKLAMAAPPAEAAPKPPAAQAPSNTPGAEAPAPAPSLEDVESRLAGDLTEAVSNHEHFSLVLIEIDHSQTLHASHGESAVLKAITAAIRVVTAVGKPDDFAAPCSADRVAVVMPSSDRTAAATLAEVVRRALAATPMSNAEGVVFQVTVSAGVATYEPGQPLRDPSLLMKAAELALMAARQSGRNCVRVFTLPKPTTAAA